MARYKTLRNALLRWDRLLSAVILGLPFVLMMGFGFIWLIQNGWLLWFLLFSATASLLVVFTRWWTIRQTTKNLPTLSSKPDLAVNADPDWLPREREAFEEVRRHIEKLTAEIQEWERLPGHAFDVVNRISRHLGGEESTALHFTVPEALLLVERTTSRYRQHLLSKVPFSDQISIATLHWLWLRRDKFALMVKLADSGRRVFRLAINPTRGVMQELEKLIASGNANYLTADMVGTIQALFLEEVAFTAVELYSGRLKFSDSELLKIQLETTESDRSRLAQPDEPLRILLVGQISAGKSSLLNALMEVELAETDTAPTTSGLITYEADVNSIPCHFIDSKGLDGSERNRKELFEQLVQSDMILWLIRADRPSREPDIQLKRIFDEWYAEHPTHRKPELIAIATCMDLLSVVWPYSENHLPDHLQAKFADVVVRIGKDLDGIVPIPISSIEPQWNLEAVFSAIESHIGAALMVQRNRRRMKASKTNSLLNQAKRGSRGIKKTAHLLGGKMVKREYSRRSSKAKNS